jgi:GMP synthase-like glutamine amidotransferase
VLVLQPQLNDGPSYLATWLREAGVAFELCCVEAGHAVPVDASPYAAVAMLGGAMSVNDDLPWLGQAEQLLRSAVALHRPVLGHCLGGQMLAKALGAAVSDNAQPEVGWTAITRHDNALARDWLGEADELTVFQWHTQTFALPAGATWLASNAACAHQAFACGPHLGMQFHTEVDAEKLQRWEADAADTALPHQPHVQSREQMHQGTALHLRQSLATAHRIYTHWWALAQGLLQARTSA